MELEYATWYWITDPREGDTWYPIFAQSTEYYMMDNETHPTSNLKELIVVKAGMPERIKELEGHRTRLFGAFSEVSSVFDEMDSIQWNEDSQWQHSSYSDAMELAFSILEETPSQSLAHIQREAIEAARDAFVEAVRAKETSSAYHFLSKYAEQLTKESE